MSPRPVARRPRTAPPPGLLAAAGLLAGCASLAPPPEAPRGGPPTGALPRPEGAAASARDGEGAAEADSLSQALAEGTPSLSIRLRLETVDQDGFDEDATAVTMRTALGYETLPLRGWQGFLELENVNDFGEAYNSTVNGTTDRPVIADPESTETNQAWIRKTFERTSVTAGRQRLVLDNARFIGDVGWRQNQQTFDAVTVRHAVGEDLDLLYGWIRNANRIFSDESPLGDARQQSHVLHAEYALGRGHELVGYWYYLDFDRDSGLAAASTSTVGTRLTGEPDGAGPVSRYALEFAQQRDAAANPRGVDAQYAHATAGTRIGPVEIDVGHETLGGSSGGPDAFTTPLATLHAHNGWADVFLTTPSTGLEDAYLRLGGRLGETKLAAVYHDFEAEAGGTQYGWELDLLATAPIDERSSWGLKWADYHAQDFATDRRKLWLWYQLDF